MRRLCLLWLTVVAVTAQAQPKAYLTDLAALKSILQKTRSYKAQIRGDRQLAYDSLYRRLALDTVSDPRSFRYFANLAQLLYPIRDNHLGLQQLYDYRRFSSKASLDSFVVSREFLTYPVYRINLDSLTARLTQQPPDSLEGIYHYGTYYTVGVFRTGPGEYTGVVVNSETRFWRKGQIALQLREFAPGRYRAIYGHPVLKILMYWPIERFSNRSLLNATFFGSYFDGVYSKEPPSVDYSHLPRGTPRFQLSHPSDQIQYLVLRSFQTRSAIAQRSRAFYDSIRHALTAPYLLVDLRDNEGGAAKEARKFLRLLKTYARRGRLYLLLNNNTVSQAELFTLQLAGRKHVTTAGQPTRGMLSYGSNYGNWQPLPGGTIHVYPTDMANGPRRLRYEDYGIRPDMMLSRDTNWVDQVIQKIQAAGPPR